jgi:Na+/H+ antiporter NhaD/arsenite permease-like protein
VLLGFLLHPVHHMDPAWVAVLGAVVLCVACSPRDVTDVLNDVGEWAPPLVALALVQRVD